MLVGLFTPVQGVHLQKENPLLLVMLVSGLHIDSDQLENEATLHFTLVAISEPSCVFFFPFLERLSSNRTADCLKTFL